MRSCKSCRAYCYRWDIFKQMLELKYFSRRQCYGRSLCQAVKRAKLYLHIMIKAKIYSRYHFNLISSFVKKNFQFNDTFIIYCYDYTIYSWRSFYLNSQANYIFYTSNTQIFFTLSFNIFLILSIKYCKVYQGLFSQISNISIWEILPNIQLYLIFRLYLRIIIIIIFVTYPVLYFILYSLDSKITFVFLVGMFLSMIVTAAT